MSIMIRPMDPSNMPTAEDAIPTYDARDLVVDGVQARLVLDGQTYVLRITRAGKLILTK
ncbi:hemin uptake protein HemP [Thalassococcus sp. S3]|nr:hemin uptake protein HemP [Thalassococcus sp. S3]